MNIKESRIERLERDEAEIKKFNFNAKYLCMSAVCKHHHEINGELFDGEFIRENYALDKALDDCKCSFSLILLNEEGSSISPKTIERVKSHKVKHN